MTAGTFVQAQSVAPQLDGATRREAVQTAARLLRDQYVFPAVGEQTAQALETALAEGSYDEYADYRAFAMRLTDDLLTGAEDKHLRVSASGALPSAPIQSPTVSPADVRDAIQSPRRDDVGVTRADILDDNIGYIEIVRFPPPFFFDGPADDAMAELRDTRALIVDMRRNLGGIPQSVTHLVSYFVDSNEPVHVISMIARTPATESFTTNELWSEATPFAYSGKPVYVLTSESTFSGGEEFAYDLQAMNLAEVVGATTRGGANPGTNIPIAVGLTMFVPFRRAESPITGTNWEGVGVIPDINVPSEDALAVALQRLGVSAAPTDIESASVTPVFVPPPRRTEPQPGAAAAVKRISNEIARGEPDYDRLTPDMEWILKQQPMLSQSLAVLGAIESINFVGVESRGFDVYDILYANGGMRWRIGLDEHDRALADFIPLPSQP